MHDAPPNAATNGSRPCQEPKNGLPEPFLWQMTPHVCRACFSRVLVRETFDHRRVYRCCGCGIEKEGRSEAAICACGIKLKTGVDAGLRCAKAESPTPEFPSEITVISAVSSPQSAT